MRTFSDFQKAFPHLYHNVQCGFYCPEPWLDVVWALSEKLEPLGVRCDQVKSKFGGLRFYVTSPSPHSTRATQLIREAERLCQDIPL